MFINMDIVQQFKEAIDYYFKKYKSQRKAAFKIGIWGIKKALFPSRLSKSITINFSKLNAINAGKVEVAFLLRGGVGDILLAERYVYEFKKKFREKVIVDVFSNLSSIIVESLFYNQFLTRKISVTSELSDKNYDLVIDIVRFPFVRSYNEKLILLSTDLALFCDSLIDFQNNHALFFNSIPTHDYLTVQLSKIKGCSRSNQADILNYFNLSNSVFKLNYNAEAEHILYQYKINNCNFITVQRGVGDGNNKSTRLWPVTYYESLISIIKMHYPQYIIVHLGSLLTEDIKGVDIDLRGKTTFEELKVLLKYSKLHIDGECGMVHIRHFLDARPSCVLFGPTDEKWLGYPENINLANRPCHSACEWLVPYWKNQCILGSQEALCQKNLLPSNVFKYIKEILDFHE